MDAAELLAKLPTKDFVTDTSRGAVADAILRAYKAGWNDARSHLEHALEDHNTLIVGEVRNIFGFTEDEWRDYPESNKRKLINHVDRPNRES